MAGRERTVHGQVHAPNLPTEEVFTSPHRERAEGTVRSTMPLALRGTIVEGLELRARGRRDRRGARQPGRGRPARRARARRRRAPLRRGRAGGRLARASARPASSSTTRSSTRTRPRTSPGATRCRGRSTTSRPSSTTPPASTTPRPTRTSWSAGPRSRSTGWRRAARRWRCCARGSGSCRRSSAASVALRGANGITEGKEQPAVAARAGSFWRAGARPYLECRVVEPHAKKLDTRLPAGPEGAVRAPIPVRCRFGVVETSNPTRVRRASANAPGTPHRCCSLPSMMQFCAAHRGKRRRRLSTARPIATRGASPGIRSASSATSAASSGPWSAGSITRKPRRS